MPQNWGYHPPVPQPGALTGGSSMPIGARDPLDAKRMAQAPGIPSAAYPDGYLGTINPRREDRVLGAIQKKLNERSYQRGVHKGEKIAPDDYYWTRDVHPMAGLERQATGKRWAHKGSDVERLVYGGKHAFTSPEELGRIASRYGISPIDPAARAETDPEFREKMRRWLPEWR